MGGRTGAGVYGQSGNRRLSLTLGQYATVFQAEVFAILVCAHEIQAQEVPGKHVSICSDSLAALKALRAVKTTSPLVRQCQEALNVISMGRAVGLFWVPGHAGVRGNEIADGLARNGSASAYVEPEPALGVSWRDLHHRIHCWLVDEHRRRWQNPGDSQRQARELISGPRRGAEVGLLSFTRAQSRVITGLLTGHNTLRRHLHVMGLVDSPLCRRCAAEDESSAHILCRCEALALVRHAYLGSFFLEPQDIKNQTLGAIWRFGRATGPL